MKNKGCSQCERKAHSRGLCRSHYDKYLKAINPSYKEAQKDNQRKWTKSNPDKVIKYRTQRSRELTAERYGISIDEVERLLNSGCSLCGRLEYLCIDHCHSTGAVRGALCLTCNVGVGWLEKEDWKQKALEYLMNSKKKE